MPQGTCSVCETFNHELGVCPICQLWVCITCFETSHGCCTACQVAKKK